MNITELDSYNLADAVKFNSKLNPAIWTGTKMRPEVREALLAIARDFEEFLGITDLELKDITVSGSNAGYTYTPHSDIDLHLVVDLLKADDSDVYRELFDAKKYAYNDMHNITIGGYDVELYVENANTKPVSKGMFSLLKNDWISIPKKRRADIDDDAVRSRYDVLSHNIESAVKSGDLKKITKLTEKIKKLRQAGLAKNGELGPENLAFKMLRSQGAIKQLYDARLAAKDRELSLNEKARVKREVKYGFKTPVPEPQVTDEMLGMQTLTEKPEPSTEETIQDFVLFCAKELKLDQPPRIKFKRDPQWSRVHKTFGRYMHGHNTLEVSLANRHLMDILRTVAHELTHQRQHEREFVPKGAGDTGSPFENEANARAGILMRDYGKAHPELFDNEPVVAESVSPHKEFAWTDYCELPTETIMAIAETYFGKNKNLLESNNPQSLSYFNDLYNLGAEPTVGSKYLMTLLLLVDNRVQVAQAPTVVRVIEQLGPNEFKVELPSGQTATFPYDIVKNNIVYHTFFFTSKSQYEKLKLAIKLKFDTELTESASGYIPKNKKEARDPRWSMALTQDIKPGQIGKEANKLGLKTDSQGHPDLLAQNLANQLREFKETGRLPQTKKHGYGYTPLSQKPGDVEDDLGNQEATGPEFPPQMPAGTTKIDVSDLTDWYRLGMDISDLDDADPEDYNLGPPQTVVVFPSDEAEQSYLKQFKRLGLKTHDMDPDVPGGEDIKGKHLKEQELDEVKMSPSSLQKFAKSPEAEGIQAGFEAELIFTGLGQPEEPEEYEPDYDADERVYSLQQIIDFFQNDEYGYGLSDREADRLRERLDEAYYEWYDNEMYRSWQDDQEELIRDEHLSEKPWVERIHDYLVDGMELSDEEADEVVANKDTDPRYEEAKEGADAILADDVQSSIDKQDDLYDRVYEDYRDNYDIGDDSGFFSDTGLRWMSDVANEYDLYWPVMTGLGGGEGGFSEDSAEQLAKSLSEELGVRVKTSSGYHSARREPGVWIIEPDSSLEADDSDNMPAEIVSPPMPLEECLRQMENFFAWAESNGAYTNSSTGFHMGVSLPAKGGSVDYTKLALFLGDEYVLQEFGRSANTFTASAMKKIKQAIESGRAKPADAMELMKHNLLELAHRAIASNEGFGKYTSINPKGNYIEFRSAGGVNYFEDLDKLKNTLLRYAQAMAIAGDPAAERREYAKKLYKLVSPKQGDPALELFARYAAGELSPEQLKAQWAEKTLEKEKPTASSTGKWRVFRSDTGETLEIIDAPNRGAAADQAYDKYTGVIRFGVEPYNETKLDLSPRAKLAKRIKDAPKNLGQTQQPTWGRAEKQSWTISNRDTGESVYQINDMNQQEAAGYALNWLRNQGLTSSDYQLKPVEGGPISARTGEPQPAGSVGQSTNPNPTIQDPRQVRMPNGVPVWELIDRDTDHVVHVIADHTQREAYNQGMAWLRSVGAEQPDTYYDRFGIRPKMLRSGERNIG